MWKQHPDENGNIDRYKIPIHTISYTDRLIVRLATDEEIQKDGNKSLDKRALATLPTAVKPISADLMLKRLAYPSKEVMMAVAKGMMPGQQVKDGIKDVAKLDSPEEKIIGSLPKKPAVHSLRDPSQYADKNHFNRWQEKASLDVHGPYTQSVTGAKYFLLLRFDTGLQIVRNLKHLNTLTDVLQDVFVNSGRPRHLLLDSGSQNGDALFMLP